MVTATRTATPATVERSILRPSLVLDAAVTGANAVAYVVAAPWLADLFGVPAPVLYILGAFLLGYTLCVVAVARTRPIPIAGVRAVVTANLAWVAASIAVAALQVWEPTTVGTVWIVVQSVVVAVFAEAQIIGLRRARTR